MLLELYHVAARVTAPDLDDCAALALLGTAYHGDACGIESCACGIQVCHREAVMGGRGVYWRSAGMLACPEELGSHEVELRITCPEPVPWHPFYLGSLYLGKIQCLPVERSGSLEGAMAVHAHVGHSHDRHGALQACVYGGATLGSVWSCHIITAYSHAAARRGGSVGERGRLVRGLQVAPGERRKGTSRERMEGNGK